MHKPTDDFTGWTRPAWHAHAACRGLGPDRFYPERGSNPDHVIRNLCARCPVRETCFEYAVTRPERHGIWAGVGERTRRMIRRERRLGLDEGEVAS